MKKKSFLTVAVLAVIALAGSHLGSIESNRNEGLSEVQIANVEALAASEHPNYINLCNKHCWNRSGYVCYLQLNTGATVYCDEMVHWTYFP